MARDWQLGLAWTEIRSAAEGHFMESMAPTAFEKTIAQNRDRIRVLFHHGQDPRVGMQVLGPIERLEPDTTYEVPLFDTPEVRSLAPGLKAGQYGASFRFHVIKDELEQHPRRSDWNPKGIPQVTVTEARVQEFGPTPLPAYRGASASARSTREIVHELHDGAYRLGQEERWATRSKPGCRGVVERERVGADEPASWERDRNRTRPWWYLSGNAFEPLPTTTPSEWRLR
jgi:phage head maturation protease